MHIWSKLTDSVARRRAGLHSFGVAHTRRWTWTILATLAIAIGLFYAKDAWAALQLNYFNVIPYPTSVTLEWSTASELNVAGFDVQCKLATEPDTSYHEIGYVQARGGPNVGMLYSFPVTSGLVPGAAYCFQLKEVTTDGSPGDVIPRCGYGPGVTPTPGAPGAIPTFPPIAAPTDAFGNAITPTPLAPVGVPTDASGNPLPPTPFPVNAVPTDVFGSPLVTPAPVNPVPTDAFGNPIPTQFVPPAPTDAFGNPIPTQPVPVPTDAFGNPIPTQPAPAPTDQFGNPIPTQFVSPLPPPVPTDAYGNPIPTATPIAAVPTDPALALAATNQALAAGAVPGVPGAPNPAFTGQDAAQAGTTDPALAGAQPPGAGQPPAAEQAQVATPTVAYIVVTATPTQAPVALAPVLTPLPTTTPLPSNLQLVNAVQPTTQNLMVMLLCLTFTGAGAIGILGLLTSVMYMRSRSSQRDFYDRSARKRLY